jgi:hypothetical protein
MTERSTNQPNDGDGKIPAFNCDHCTVRIKSNQILRTSDDGDSPYSFPELDVDVECGQPLTRTRLADFFPYHKTTISAPEGIFDTFDAAIDSMMVLATMALWESCRFNPDNLETPVELN